MRISKRAALLVVTAAVTLVAACGTPAATHVTHRAVQPAARTISKATVRKTVSPYDAHGRLVVTASHVVHGSCFTASIASPSPNSYRCFSGNQILDPCVAPPATGGTTPAEVACLNNPWSGATVIRLTKPLPTDAPLGEHDRPWAFTLDNGARCVASTGTVPSVADVLLPYFCTDGTAAALVDATARTVSVRYGRTTGTTLTRHEVRTLWRT